MVPVSYLDVASQSRLRWHGLERGRAGQGSMNVPEENTTKGNEQADDDGRGGRACHMVGFLEHDAHDEGSFCRTITTVCRL